MPFGSTDYGPQVRGRWPKRGFFVQKRLARASICHCLDEMVGRRLMRLAPTVVLLATALCVLVSGSGAAGVASSGVRACSSAVQHGTLPVWARGGFHPPTQRIPHVLGRSKAIVAILWADPLEAPPPINHNNKILWVPRRSFSSFTTLRISAQRMSGTRFLGKPVQRSVRGGPGPSIIDLPTAGCWRFALRWAGRRDSLDLQYRPRR